MSRSRRSGPDGANGRTAGIAGRKADHLRINLEADVAAKGIDSGFGE